MSWYFAYGSNMCRQRLEARVGGCEPGGAARLDGHVLRFHKRGRDGSGKCDAYGTGRADDAMHGVLFGLSAAQCEALHAFEGPGYAVRSVRVATSGGDLEAFAYVAHAHAVDPALEPFDWYKAFVVAGAREAGLPASYLSALDAVPARRDPDPARARDNDRILRALAG